MEASTSRKPFRGGSGRDLLSTRRGSLLLAGVTALLAGALIFLFVDSRDGGGVVGGGSERVLVAKRLIPKGSPGDVVGAQQLAVATTLEGEDLKEGAISDPKALAGKAAVADIYPGQQLTTADFTAAAVGLSAKLTGDQRAVAVPVDAAHGLIGSVQAGDHVDVFVGLSQTGGSGGGSVVRTLLQNALVLSAAGATDTGATGGGGGSTIILRASDRDATKLAFAADNGQVWIALRPPAGAKQSPTTVVTLESLLADNASVGDSDDGSGD